MKDLRFFLENADSDFEAIRSYMQQDECIADSISMLTDLSKHRVNTLVRWKNMVESNMIFPFDCYYRKYDNVTAARLDALTRKMVFQYEFGEKDIEFMKKFDLPESGPFWHDLAEAIRYYHDEENYTPKYFNYDPENFKSYK